MLETKPNAIRTVGGIIIAISVMMIFSNSLFVIFGSDFDEPNSTSGFDPFNYFNVLGYAFIFIGVALFIGGVFLLKFKLWANRLLTAVAGLAGTAILIIFLVIAYIMPSEPSIALIFKIAFSFFAFLAAIPFVLLIRFLNRERILKHFA
ncbi:hypothetical protein [Muriicola jejuensis]|uniref:DUF4293 family protein n=1 Tax=Muriicola jejuensis TaxID=504488 RepID=A0A6P0UGP7_9FLAO|nr:hypothetical protein [Muriicola jejuensis]NER11630.1 hypothetical protein [Muriicola jejuensis]